uniref:Laminin, alpha 1 n=1 Tax=Cyprinus carpio TaxID=7962 RepID=A0A8C1LL52_CYPCA
VLILVKVLVILLFFDKFFKQFRVNASSMLLLNSSSSVVPGLFPAILNLASNAEITTNATCGDPLPEMFCKLVEHVPGRRIRNPQCRICDANSQNPKEQHPITNAIDGTNQWWQSPSIKNGPQFHWVTITLDLRQVFQVAYIIIKAANSPRPGNWILERSLDGVDFQPWQYYAISDTECLTRYNITPRLGPPTYKRDDEVICTSYYSRLVPLEHGEIHTSLINGRPSADDLTPELLEYTSARFIRLRLQRIRTLNADLMTLSYRDPKDVDPIVTRRYYYSIKDISVGGMCICYGHAQSCPWDPVTKKLQCVCEHNTCGESCNECCPGYHQEPWQPGTLSDGNTCEKCNCHNKAVDCYYNQTVADLRLSVNTHGQLVGGGVCVNCSQNTAGVNCQTCADGYYRPHQVSPYADDPCVECQCDSRGSASLVCIRDDNHSDPGLTAGQCLCKEGFAGEKCDRCAFGFRDFPQCTRCECNLAGSHNVDPCSECVCKVNVMGSNCDLCKQGFYNLQASNPEGCTECFCFGVSDVCESSTWFSSSVPSFLFQLTSYGSFLNYSVAYDTSEENVDKTLQAHFSVIIEVRRTSREAPPTHASDCVCFVHRLSSVSLGVGDTNSGLSKIPLDVEQCECPWGYSGTSCEVRNHFRVTLSGYCIPGFYRVGGILFGGNCLQCECNDHAAECDINGECLGCAHNTTGPHCDQCLPGFYGDASEGTPDDCQRCSCPLTLESNNVVSCHLLVSPLACDCAHTHGNCNAHTGECICPPHTLGLKCEECEEGHWGHDGVSGCKACNCSAAGSSSSQCDLQSGQCRCRQHFSGLRCDRCALGYKNFPECTACNCSPDGTREEFCDPALGVCGCQDHGRCSCKENVGGSGCDECRTGTFGLTAQNPSGCSPCFCSGVSSACEELGGLIRVPSDLQGTLEGVSYSDQEMLLDASHLHSLSVLTAPYYWRLPHKYHGNKLLSYGGRLSYTLAFSALDGVGLANQEPQVLMRGGHLRRLVIYTELPAPENGVRTRHELPLTEHTWKYFNSVSDEAVSHADFMSVLSNLEYIIIKASYGSGLQQSRISNISMDTALEADEAPQGGDVARLVEACECPLGYAGLSCQECAPGYYRQAISELSMKGRSRPLIRPCVPCRCNNHSLSCDLDTGECLGCQHNTAGQHCHVCAAGYYGKVQGSVSDCSLCACPLRGQSQSELRMIECHEIEQWLMLEFSFSAI